AQTLSLVSSARPRSKAPRREAHTSIEPRQRRSPGGPGRSRQVSWEGDGLRRRIFKLDSPSEFEHERAPQSPCHLPARGTRRQGERRPFRNYDEGRRAGHGPEGPRLEPGGDPFPAPDLNLGQIHSALAYSWDHQAELDADIERRSRYAEAARREVGPS